MDVYSQEMSQRKEAMEQKLENEKNDMQNMLGNAFQQILDAKGSTGKNPLADMFKKSAEGNAAPVFSNMLNRAKPQQPPNMMQALRKNLNKQGN